MIRDFLILAPRRAFILHCLALSIVLVLAILFLVVSAIIILIPSCSSDKPTPTTVPGTYLGRYPGEGEEVFILKNDGTYTQELKVSGKIVYNNSGTWFINKDREIEFHNFMKACEQDRTGLHISPQKFDNFFADWTSNPSQLIFNIDANYVAIDYPKNVKHPR